MRLIPAILILLTAFQAFGQESTAVPASAPDIILQRTDFPGNQHKREKIISEALTLTEEQSQQWLTLSQAFQTQAKEILQNNTLNPAQKQEQFSKAQQDHEKKIKALLTEDQFEKYRQWNAKRRDRWRALRRMEDRQLPGRTAPGKS